MNLKERIEALVNLGESISYEDDAVQYAMYRSEYDNKWFTIPNIKRALDGIIESFLKSSDLTKWTEMYSISDELSDQTVALILAGNIPMVGFHDVLCSFLAGFKTQIKLSHKDQHLIPFLVNKLNEIDNRTSDRFSIVEKIGDFNLVIATGSNNSSDLFEQYFSKFPNLIRKNRNAVAVLSGDETEEDFHKLADDIFMYFGLGCRNVSKIYIPEDFDLQGLLDVLHTNNKIVLHSKYKNNYDYNFAISLLNSDQFLACGAIMIRKASEITSRIACLHYEHYQSEKQLVQHLEEKENEIQCIVSQKDIAGLQTFKFGEAQSPQLWDYADGVDTMAFLLNNK